MGGYLPMKKKIVSFLFVIIFLCSSITFSFGKTPNIVYIGNKVITLNSLNFSSFSSTNSSPLWDYYYVKQYPVNPDNPEWYAVASSTEMNQKVYDNFEYDYSFYCQTLSWWGFIYSWDSNPPSITTMIENMTFRVELYKDNNDPSNAPPTNKVLDWNYTIEDNVFNYYHTGIFFQPYDIELLLFECVLIPLGHFPNGHGWVSIQSSDPDGEDFFWLNSYDGDNYSYAAGPVPPYDLWWDSSFLLDSWYEYWRGLRGTELHKKWNMVSIPVNDTFVKNDVYFHYGDKFCYWNPASGDLINEYAFGWDRVNQTYYFANKFKPGEGYWIFARKRCTAAVFRIPDYDEPFNTEIKTGWNLVSIPHNDLIDKNDIMIITQNKEILSWNQAVNYSIINNYVFGWSRWQQSYEMINKFVPGYGYWIYAYEPCILHKNS
jgi:hypothetical protein